MMISFCLSTRFLFLILPGPFLQGNAQVISVTAHLIPIRNRAFKCELLRGLVESQKLQSMAMHPNPGFTLSRM